MDPVRCVDEECGSISESQEERLARAPFLNDDDEDDDAPIFLSASSSEAFHARSPPPLPFADAPILICSLPDTPAPDLALDDDTALAKGKSPAPDTPEPSTAKKSAARRRRSRGARLNTADADDPTQENPNEIDRTPNPPSGLRKLPASVTKPSSAAPDPPPPAFPASLLDVIKAFSGKPNRRFGDADILDILKMKGIEFPNPQWWRPEGYELKWAVVSDPDYPSLQSEKEPE